MILQDMKKTFKIGLGLFSLLLCSVVSTYAQSRPVWVVGHRCNSKITIAEALKDGANGVEMDVSTNGTYKGSHWCVDHDKCWSPSRCKGEQNNTWTLKDYLQLPELKNSNFRLLWVDCKDEKYLKELVEYVHKYIPADADYDICYSIYKLETVFDIKTGSDKLLAWLRDNLRKNEGISFGYERRHDAIQYAFDITGFPYKKHFFQDGNFNSYQIIKKNSRWRLSLKEAGIRKSQDKFCSRVGAWTALNGNHGNILLDSAYAGFETGCDVICIECRKTVKDFFLASPDALKDCISKFVSQSSTLHLADKKDKFYPD